MREFFFTFPDGSLDYDCAACGGACCRGHGFGGARGRALTGFLDEHPALELMVVRAAGSEIDVATTRTGCPLQDVDGLCSHHSRRGLESLPTVCRLFPFDILRRVGDTLFVSPHHLCPLELVVPPAPGRVKGSHEALRLLLGAMEPEMFEAKSPLPSPADALAVVRRERLFLEHVTSRLGASRFLETLESLPSHGPGVAALAERVSQLLGLDPGARRPVFTAPVEAVLHALAPGLRVDMLHLQEPAALAALTITARVVFEVLREWRGPAPTLQTVHDIAWAQQPTIRLLAAWDELPRGVATTIPRDLNAEQCLDLGLMFGAFNQGRGGWERLSEVAEDRPRYVTISLLKDLARSAGA